MADPNSQMRRGVRHLIRDSSPIYLLSAACMLTSCVLLANDFVHRSVPLSQLLTLIATLVAYQAAVFGLGALLLLRRGLRRDGRLLLLLDAVFLSDVAFVHSELLISNLSIGLAVGLLLAALAGIRIDWIARRLGFAIPLHRYFLITLNLVLLVAIPAYLKRIDDGVSVTPAVFNALWWLAGLVLAGGALADHARLERPDPRAAGSTWLQRVYLIVPFSSLLLHLIVLHYVYTAAFSVAMLSPLLIGGAVLLKRLEYGGRDWAAQTGPLRLAMLVLAILFASAASRELNTTLNVVRAVHLSPLALTCAATYAAIAYLFLLRYALWYLLAGGTVSAMVLLGPTMAQMGETIAVLGRGAIRLIRAVLPATRTGWGVLGVAASFALLGLGAWRSLRRPPEPPGVAGQQSLTPAVDPLPRETA